MDSPIRGTQVEQITVRADTPADFERIHQERLADPTTPVERIPINGTHGHRDYLKWAEGTEGTPRCHVAVHAPFDLGFSAGPAPGGAPAGERSRPLS